MSFNKFYNLKDLLPRINAEREQHKTITLANGGFDLLHIGHVRYLKDAKKISDILIVALNSDESLRRLKGKRRPIIDQKGRIKILSSIEYVDYVTLFDEDRVSNVLLAIKPDYHCKGSDYTVESVPEIDTVKSYNGKTAIVGGDKVRSTSEIIKVIKQL